VHLGKAARRLHLPEGARAGLEEILMELALVEAPVPARGVEERERVAALLHALHRRLDLGRAIAPARLDQTRLQRRLQATTNLYRVRAAIALPVCGEQARDTVALLDIERRHWVCGSDP